MSASSASCSSTSAASCPSGSRRLQAIVLPISDRHLDYGAAVLAELAGAGVRAELDDRTESVGAQDPRRRAAQDPVHARRRRPRAGGGGGRRPRARRRAMPGRRPLTEFVPRSDGNDSMLARCADQTAILSPVDPRSASHPARRRLTYRRHRS